jgi:hypothetical protein
MFSSSRSAIGFRSFFRPARSLEKAPHTFGLYIRKKVSFDANRLNLKVYDAAAAISFRAARAFLIEGQTYDAKETVPIFRQDDARNGVGKRSAGLTNLLLVPITMTHILDMYK